MNKTLDEMKMIHEEEMQSYGRIQDRVISVMLSHGCKIVQTPSFEDYDSYGTYFPSLRKEMIKTIDSDGSVLVLRPDVTLPLVKAAAIEFPDGSELLKYGYVTTVFRNYYGMTSHGRDFLQAGVEVLGDPTPECDGEVIVTAAEFLESVGIESMRIDLGTVAYMDALFEALELSERQADELRAWRREIWFPLGKSQSPSPFLASGARRFWSCLRFSGRTGRRCRGRVRFV